MNAAIKGAHNSYAKKKEKEEIKTKNLNASLVRKPRVHIMHFLH